MGKDGRRGPKPYEQHQASTVFLRVPASDWPSVKLGHKTEFRGEPGAVSGLFLCEPPTPVVAYSWRPATGHDARLMVLEKRWQEPLGALTDESLEREGQPDLAHFRRYWMERTQRRFQPNSIVTVFRVRPFTEQDRPVFAARLLERLYEAFLDPA